MESPNVQSDLSPLRLIYFVIARSIVIFVNELMMIPVNYRRHHSNVQCDFRPSFYVSNLFQQSVA